MRKNFGARPSVYPMPVFIIGTYDENGAPDAMNMENAFKDGLKLK